MYTLRILGGKIPTRDKGDSRTTDIFKKHLPQSYRGFSFKSSGTSCDLKQPFLGNGPFRSNWTNGKSPSLHANRCRKKAHGPFGLRFSPAFAPQTAVSLDFSDFSSWKRDAKSASNRTCSASESFLCAFHPVLPLNFLEIDKNLMEAISKRFLHKIGFNPDLVHFAGPRIGKGLGKKARTGDQSTTPLEWD